MPNPSKPLLEVSTLDQYRTIDELFEQSKPNSAYYSLLVLSSLIITPGLLLNNTTIIIGGMLVTPLLTPLLVIGLGLAVGEPKHIVPTSILLLKSIGIVLGISFLLTLLFSPGAEIFLGYNETKTAFLYFLVAVVSGIAAALAKAHKEISEVLPGVAIAISLVPPLSLVGIWLAGWEPELVRFYLFIFILNFIGIVLGSLVVFSMLKFYRAQSHVKQTAEDTAKQVETEKNNKAPEQTNQNFEE